MAVATLSVFVVPMTETFGWSRGQFSGAVSLGALFGLIVSPVAGRLIDRYGSAVLLSASAAVVGLSAIGLSLTAPIWSFYLLYVPGRAVFSSPLELGTSTAVSN
ncbi:MAG: MFS transporter, partial [SAR202 cluster bacterium]